MDDHWLTRDSTIKRLWIVFVDRPCGHRPDGSWYPSPQLLRSRRHLRLRAWFGFLSCVALISSRRRWGRYSSARIPTTMLTSFLLPLADRGGLCCRCCGPSAIDGAPPRRCSRFSLSGRCRTGSRCSGRFLGYELILVKGDALSRLFATVFALMALRGRPVALNQNRVAELAAAFAMRGARSASSLRAT